MGPKNTRTQRWQVTVPNSIWLGLGGLGCGRSMAWQEDTGGEVRLWPQTGKDCEQVASLGSTDGVTTDPFSQEPRLSVFGLSHCRAGEPPWEPLSGTQTLARPPQRDT
jgi:hypothetical protein